MSGTISTALHVFAEKNPQSAIAKIYNPPQITERSFFYDFKNSGYRHTKKFSAEEHRELFVTVSEIYCEEHDIKSRDFNGDIFWYSGIRKDVYKLGIEITKREGIQHLKSQRPKTVNQTKVAKPHYVSNPL
jgi:predicted dehydrogenase